MAALSAASRCAVAAARRRRPATRAIRARRRRRRRPRRARARRALRSAPAPAPVMTKAQALLARATTFPPERRALVLVRRRRGALGRRAGDGVGGLHAGRSARRLDAVHLRRGAHARKARRCPTAIAACSSGSRTISSTATASRSSPARRTTSSCTASSRRCRCCARASCEDASAPCHDQESVDVLEAVETVVVRGARRTSSATRQQLARIARRARGRAPAGAGWRRCRSWRPQQARSSPPRWR